MNKKVFLWLIPLGICIFVFGACNFNSQKNETQNATANENLISEELHQEHCNLLAKANEELAGINQKVRNLNDKIRKKGGKFSDKQNTALDNFELKQASINKRMHEIKNIKQEDWVVFKTQFETDLEEITAIIDQLLTEF
jgi:hypothetical protein